MVVVIVPRSVKARGSNYYLTISNPAEIPADQLPRIFENLSCA